jgi:8-oxo-(d)GTP phosphatase
VSNGRAAGEIRAAGAVLWRQAGRDAELALIHRPKYDDWTFPKGKVDRGEHVLLAAVREVAEETGMRVTLGRKLGHVKYLAEGLPKRVDYWAASARPGQDFVANKEVDRMEWLAAAAARGRLSYRHDERTLAAFSAGPRQTSPLVLVRHASAGNKSGWQEDDLLRPLDARGVLQAERLKDLLDCFGQARVISSPAERCVATVRPYAAAAGGQVQVEPAFAVAGADAGGALAARNAAARLAADGQPTVICAHRENLPLLLDAICEQLGAEPPTGPPLRKAGFWVLHRASGWLAAAERHDCEPGELAAPGRAVPRARARLLRRRGSHAAPHGPG